MIIENTKEIGFNLETEAKSDKNNSFSVIFTSKENSFLEIHAFQKNNLFKNIYYNKFSPEKIKENKYFIQFDDLNEIFEELYERIKKNRNN